MAENTDALAPGTTLGRHILLAKLGEGGMGAVFMARHLLLDRIDAIKVIRPHLVRDPGVLARFYQEARAAARLHHTNVVAIHDADQADGQHFLVLEFVQGTDLAALLRQKRNLSEQLVIGILYQTARGLQHIHEKGLVHRDIKPSNLLLASTTKQIKILDLGLAGLRVGGHDEAGRLTSTLQVMGTPDYIAPEQSISTRDADIRADLYALGCTAYHLLAGTVPFPDGDLFDKIRRHRDEPPLPLAALRKDLSSELVAIIARLMAKNPQARHQTPAELLAALKHLRARAESGSSAPSTVHPSSNRETLDLPEATPAARSTVRKHGDRTTLDLHPPKPSRRRVLLGLGLAGLTAASAAAYWFWPPRRQAGNNQEMPESGLAPAWVASHDTPVPNTGWKIVDTLHPQCEGIFGIAWAPDGNSLAITSGVHEEPDRPGSVLIYDLTEKRWRSSCPTTRCANQLHFMPDGKTLVSGTGSMSRNRDTEGWINIWNFPAGSLRNKVKLFETSVCGILGSREGNTVYVGNMNGTVQEVELTTAKAQQVYQSDVALSSYPAWSDDGRLLAWPCNNGSILVFEMPGWKLRRHIPATDDLRTPVIATAFRDNDRQVLGTTGCSDSEGGRLRIWDTATGDILDTLGVAPCHLHGMALSPDRQTLAIGTQDGELKMWNMDTRKLVLDRKLQDGLIWGTAFSPGRPVLATTGNGVVHLWEPKS